MITADKGIFCMKSPRKEDMVTDNKEVLGTEKKIDFVFEMTICMHYTQKCH